MVKKNLFFIVISLLISTDCLAAVSTLITRGSVLPAGIVTTQGISSSKLDNTSTTAGFVIGTSGYYYLSNDLSYNGTTADIPCILINSDDVVLDLGSKTITVASGISGKAFGVEVASGKNNVVIKNGTIKGMSNCGIVLTSNTNVNIEDISIVACTGTNVTVKAQGLSAIGCKGIYATNLRVLSNSDTDADVNGIYLSSCESSRFNGGNISANTVGLNGFDVYGTQLSSCVEIAFSDVIFSNNNVTYDAKNAYGVYLSSCRHCIFTNCSAVANYNGASEDTNTGTSAGFYLTGSTANSFEGCIADSNYAPQNAYGFAFISDSDSNSCKKCSANENYNVKTNNSATSNAIGFYANASDSNQFDECLARHNYNSNDTAATSYDYDAAGFWFQASNANVCQACGALNQASLDTASTSTVVGFAAISGSANTFFDCEALYNTTQSTASESIAGGFLLSAETGSLITNCKANSNNASGLNSKAYGIDLAGTNSRCAIQGCMVTSNRATSSNGYSFGIFDHATDSTTYFRANTSFGHGHTFSGTSIRNPNSYDMNFYVAYAESTSMDPMNIIKEADIANLNIIAEAGGKDIFNWSIVTQAVN